MHGVEHMVSLLLNDMYKVPIFHQMISDHKVIYNILVTVYIKILNPYLN